MTMLILTFVLFLWTVASIKPNGSLVFFENFDSPIESRWSISSDPAYTGGWLWGEAKEVVGAPDDKGLIVVDSGRKSAIRAIFPTPLEGGPGKTIVIQYEVKFHQKLNCGGAYIKLLADQGEENTNTAFNGSTPYIIMFGPDICGHNDRVHFIFRHENPLSKTWEEKHMRDPPYIKNDRKTHLYTLIVKPDSSFEIFIDLLPAKKGHLLRDFDPPVVSPKFIDDPDDVKPSDWVDEARIPDPNAKKPEDWDEDEPREIPDFKATKPENWDESEPMTLPDTNASPPKGWDEEEDGKWEPPQIPNPACAKKGCGPWSPPLIPNPKFRGKWMAPKIPNPAYKGPWRPRQIPNPHFHEDKHPAHFPKMVALAIEIMTIQPGIIFDNFIISYDPEAARGYAKKTWMEKYRAESVIEPSEDDHDVLDDGTITYFIKGLFKSQPGSGLSTGTIIILIITLVPMMFLSMLWMGSKTPKDKDKKKDDAKDEKSSSEDEEESDDDKDSGSEQDDDSKTKKSKENTEKTVDEKSSSKPGGKGSSSGSTLTKRRSPPRRQD